MKNPVTLAEFAFGNQKAKTTILDIVNLDRVVPENNNGGILLHGPYGTGKSKCAELLVQELGKAHGLEKGPNVNKLRFGVGNNGLQTLASISNTVAYRPIYGDYHYFILDEVDQLTSQASLLLKTTMDDSQGTAIFVMTTNFLHRLDGGVVGRSIPISFVPDSDTVYVPFARDVLAYYGFQDAYTVPESFIVKSIIERDDLPISGNSPREICKRAPQVALDLKRKMRAMAVPVQPPTTATV